MASFVDLFSATDSDGASAARYRLIYEGSIWSNQYSWIFGMFTSLIYAVYKVIAVAANGLLGLVLSSGSWMDPLSEGYRKFTAPLYEIIPPWGIAAGGMAVVVFSTWRSKPKSTGGGIDSASLNRIGTAFALMALVIVLTQDPFALMTKVLELANSFSVGLASAVSGSSNGTTITTGQALVDSSIRTPTIALTYGQDFSSACKTAWSQAMVSGGELSPDSGCFNKDDNKAGPDSVITAITMLFLPAIPMLVFSVIAAWKYVLHLTLAVACTLASAWVAATSIYRRRSFEDLSKVFAHAGAHLVMTVITSMVAVALPATVAGLAQELLGLATSSQAQAFVMMVGLGIGFIVSTWVLLRVTSNKGVLVRLLQANANDTLQGTLGMKPKKFSDINRTGWYAAKELLEKETQEKAKADAAAAKQAPAGGAPKTGKDGAPVPTISQADDDDVNALTKEMKGDAPDRAGANPVNIEPKRRDFAETLADSIAVSELAAKNPGGGAVVAADGGKRDDKAIPDAFGYYPPKPNTSPNAEVDDDTVEPSSADQNAVGALTAGVLSTPDTGDQSSAAGTAPAPVPTSQTGSPLATPAGSVIGAPPAAPTSQTGSPLATPVGSVIGAPAAAPADTPSVPVPGNLALDGPLNEAARDVGGTLDVPTKRPDTGRPLSSGGHFGEGVPSHAPALGVPPVDHGEPLLVTAGDVTPTGTTGPDPEVSSEPDADPAKPVNEQQGWDRRDARYRSMRPLRRGANTPAPRSRNDSHTAHYPAGIKPGRNTNPMSYHAPSRDFLATEQLQSELEMASITAAAAGNRPQIRLSDSRISLRMSSNPERRVISSARSGFGDPY